MPDTRKSCQTKYFSWLSKDVWRKCKFLISIRELLAEVTTFTDSWHVNSTIMFVAKSCISILFRHNDYSHNALYKYEQEWKVGDGRSF